MAVTHFTTDEVVHRTMDILHDGVESNKQNMLREEGDAEVDSDDENGTGSDSDYLEKVLKKQMNPEDWVAGGVVLEKCFDVVVVVEGYEGDKHKCWWRTGMRQLYFYVSDASVWFYLKLCPVILKVVK